MAGGLCCLAGLGSLAANRCAGSLLRQKNGRVGLLQDAAQYIVPVAISAKASIDDLYTKADGAFLSASYAGPFRKDRLTDAGTMAMPRPILAGKS